jgi:hypothetical protein
VVDWTSSDDAQNVIRNEIDDYLYELKEVRNVELGLDEMDRILDGAIRIARTRYPQKPRPANPVSTTKKRRIRRFYPFPSSCASFLRG